MIYKNSLKIMMSNFSLVSRILLLMVVHFAIVFGISYMFLLPVINLLVTNNWFELARGYYMEFLQSLNAQAAFQNLGQLFATLENIISANFARIGFYLIGLLFVLVFLSSLFSNFYSLIVTNCLYQSMSNNVKYKFGPSLVSTLGTNLKFSFIALFVKLPFALINIVLVVFSFRLLFVGGVVSFFAPVMIMLILFVLESLRSTIFYGWTPSIVVFDKGIINGLNKSLSLTFHKTKKVFANSFYIILTIFVINVFAALVTFGASLVITLPMSVLLYQAFAMVVFYSNYGMRYYVDEFNVIVPTKMEKTEPICNMKHII